jgi:hypothetical protein
MSATWATFQAPLFWLKADASWNKAYLAKGADRVHKNKL